MLNISLLIKDLGAIRRNAPLIHNITNYVVMNNTANALLAIGASPVMAHAKEEVAEMVALAGALVLNIGTLEPAWVDAMHIAARTAGEKGIPVILDPVGAGATSYRTETANRLIEEFRPAVIRGNASEIIALVNSNTRTKGVDSTEPSELALESARKLASEYGTVVTISGEIDYITDGKNVACVFNGDPMMARVTGMGCTATAIIGAFAAVNDNSFLAALHGMALMGVCGEIAAAHSKGNGSLQLNFLDELYTIDQNTLAANLKQKA